MKMNLLEKMCRLMTHNIIEVFPEGQKRVLYQMDWEHWCGVVLCCVCSNDVAQHVHHWFTSIMQRTMTEIPVNRKFSSKKFWSLAKHPCIQRTNVWEEWTNSQIQQFDCSIIQILSTCSQYTCFVSQKSLQQESGTFSPQSVELLIPQHFSWSKNRNNILNQHIPVNWRSGASSQYVSCQHVSACTDLPAFEEGPTHSVDVLMNFQLVLLHWLNPCWDRPSAMCQAKQQKEILQIV